MTTSLTILIIDKLCSIKTLNIKDYKVEELYKKCGFKKQDGFTLQVEWSVKLNGKKYIIEMYGKLDGKANMENKYEFPPPIDKNLYFGSCALVGMVRDNYNKKVHINLNIELWNKIYEKLFGGFEDLATTCKEDEEEEDELENIPKNMKTKKGGYLKDGFVVDTSDSDISVSDYEEDSDKTVENCKNDNDNDNDDLELDDVGSELSEESYIESDKE